VDAERDSEEESRREEEEGESSGRQVDTAGSQVEGES
jgi:hypothetical protein